VLDLPAGQLNFQRTSSSIFLSAYHGRPVAACYNSFSSPLTRDIGDLAARLPSTGAAEALHALGFRVLVVHRGDVGEQRRMHLDELLGNPERATGIGRTATLDVFALRGGRRRPTQDFAVLAPGRAARGGIRVATGASATVPITIANRSGGPFRHPRPIEPRQLRVEWRDPRGRVVMQEAVRALLPVALGSGERVARKLTVATPSTGGEYRMTASLPERPHAPLASVSVTVEPERAE
jgi:hypothetical protein